ncbi:hypothetical protein FF098_017075 [Parvularcula flava]|uniref:Uncharacterized protein n=1 Tax=Aquisalinus luteolus TaxID=1566827 RepID=A0A8J3ESV0_9PROT|nr:hypothetical protein [Aquisalinus luteolus]NHK29623.1 hypothetical protein [Aquisalinus luteolus]GGI02302.1 hypothetical protein GCM10011355_34990 [Aquisalinus luteolus]
MSLGLDVFTAVSDEAQPAKIAALLNTASMLVVPPDFILLSPRYKHEVAKILKETKESLKGTEYASEREGTADFICALLSAPAFPRIQYVSGKGYHIYPDMLYDVLPEDMSLSWFSELLSYADEMPKRKSSVKILPRMRLMSVVLALYGRPVPLRY